MPVAGLSNLVAEVLHNRGDDNSPDWSVGSGFFVDRRLVLTALHNVDGPGELLVRVHGTEERPALVRLQGDKDIIDLAVLEVSDVAVDVPPLRYGAVDRSAPAVVERCWAVGFPRFKERVHDPKPLRLSVQVDGEIPTGENLDQPLLTLRVRNSPRPLPSGSVRESEWEGISGATVFSGNYIIVGVITEHHLPEGESALTVVPITAIDLLPKAEATKWWKLLGVEHQALVRLPGEAPSSLSLPARPESFIPIPHSSLFQPRPDEFENLERLLFESKGENRPPRLGLVGMAGVGKTQLAVELAHRCLAQNRFPAGIFWMIATGKGIYDWQPRLAELAFNTGYLPPDDDVSSPENERRRAIYICRYFAMHADALLILDNVDDPNLVVSVLPTLAGGEISCAILYTSRIRRVSAGITPYVVGKLSAEVALRLLLSSTRPELLKEALNASPSEEAQAARTLCALVDYLPLALVHLRALLNDDPELLLTKLVTAVQEQGTLEIANDVDPDVVSLTASFRLSWQKVQGADAQRLFKLAAYFTEAAPISLWLLGLAAGLGEKTEGFTPLGRVWLRLQQLSLLEKLSNEQVRLHPLVREFGRRLVAEEPDKGKILLEETGERLISEFEELNRLERRARQEEGYWGCLEQVRMTREYVELLGTDQAEQVARIESLLDHESYVLGDERWWPKTIPELFYQQIFNRSVEEGSPLRSEEMPRRWLRQLGQVGAEDRSLLRIFAGHAGTVTSVAFSPDGRQVLTGGSDGTMRLLETSSGKLLAILQSHATFVTSVAFSPDGRQVLTRSKDGTAQLWETGGGNVLVAFNTESVGVTSVAFSPNGRQVLTGLTWTTFGGVQLWEADSGDLLVTFKGHGHIGNGFPSGIEWGIRCVMCVAFSPDGKQVLTGDIDGAMQLWETGSGKLLATFKGHTKSVTSVAFSPDGKQVLSGSEDGTAQLWEIDSGNLLATLQHSGSVNSVAFSPDGRQVLSGSEDGTAQLWETDSGKLLVTFAGHMGSVTSVAFSPDGRQVLSGSEDGTARLWETVSRKRLSTLEDHSREITRTTSVAFSPDGRQVLSGSEDKTVRLWETASGELLSTYEGHTDRISSVAFSPDGGKVLTGSWDGTARLWEIGTGRELATFGSHATEVASVAFSPDGRQLLIGAEYGGARLWETSSGKPLATLWEHISSSAEHTVRCVAFSPDSKQVLIGSADGTVRLWETGSGKLLSTLQDPIYSETGAVYSRGGTTYIASNSVTCVAFSSNGRQVLSGSEDGMARLWETSSGRLLATFENHTGSVTCVAFSPDDRFVMTCDEHGRVFLWRESEPERGRLLGLYVTTYKVGAIYWQNNAHVMLADTGGSLLRPHFYQLQLEGTW